MDSYRTQSPDTTLTVERILLDGYRRMTPWQKLERVFSLTESVRFLAKLGIKERNPGITEENAQIEMMRLRLGDALSEKFLAFSAKRKTRGNAS